MASVREYLEKRLRLKVNEDKSAVDQPWKRKFLGFSLWKSKDGYKVRLTPQTVKRFKEKVRKLTNRNRTQNLEERIKNLNEYLRGWLGYFRLIEMPSVLRDLEGWVRTPVSGLRLEAVETGVDKVSGTACPRATGMGGA